MANLPCAVGEERQELSNMFELQLACGYKTEIIFCIKYQICLGTFSLQNILSNKNHHVQACTKLKPAYINSTTNAIELCFTNVFYCLKVWRQKDLF